VLLQAQGDASSQQNLMQQQSAALQAALATQRLTPAQSQQLLLLQQQAQRQAPDISPAAAPSASGQPQGVGASSQELGVAQMMMTLAQAAGCSTSTPQNVPKTKP